MEASSHGGLISDREMGKTLQRLKRSENRTGEITRVDAAASFAVRVVQET
jgi:hypothetical protein